MVLGHMSASLNPLLWQQTASFEVQRSRERVMNFFLGAGRATVFLCLMQYTAYKLGAVSCLGNR